MKKRLYLIATILLSAAALSLSSCLKDKRYVDFASGSNIAYFPKGGTPYFTSEAITESPDTDANGTIVRQFAVGIATVNPPSSATTINLAIDTTIVATYNAANPAVSYTPMPAGSYVFNTPTVTIPAGQQYATVSVTFYKNKLDPSKSYMLPIKIAGNSAGLKISGNMGIQYYHFIGNDFAGIYRWKFQRYNAADSTSAALNGSSFGFAVGNTTVFNPVSPTEFTVYSGYVSGAQFRYDVTFTKTGNGASATYTNFHVDLVASDVAAEAGSISVGQHPVFFDPVTHAPATADLPGPYTFAQAQTIFHFQWEPVTSAPRYILDTYAK